MSDPLPESRRAHRRAVGILLFLATLAGCRRQEPSAPVATTEPTPVESAQALEALTGKAPVKLTWLEGNRLFGFDSFHPSQPVLLREAEGLDRPLLTPDGAAVIFTEAGKIHAMTWPAREDRALADGFALAVLRDAGAKEDWVYAATTASGEKIFRFRLRQPEIREAVWDKAPVDPRHVQISRDGQRLSGRFFGIDSGLADLALARWDKVAGSRPLALAPDASHVLAMLDGTGRRLRFFHPSGTPWDPMAEALVPPASWQATLPTDPAAAGLRFGDLRWTNHPRFLLLSATRHPRGRLAVSRLAADTRTVEKLALLATAGPEVRAADAWVAGGEAAVLEGWPPSPEPSTLPDQAGDGSWLRWPRSFEGVVFAWSNERSINQLPDRPQPCRVIPRGLARFGDGGEMLLDHGAFEADMTSARALAAVGAKGNAFSIEMLLDESVERHGPISCRLMALELDDQRDAFSLSRVDESLVLRVLLDSGDGTEPREYQSRITPVMIESTRPMSLVIEVDRGRITWHIDARVVGESQTLGPPSLAAWKPDKVKRLAFGDADPRGSAGWRGRLEKVLINNRPFNWEELSNDVRTSRTGHLRLAPRTVRVQATLREVPELPAATPGRRFLAQQVYDVGEVISGDLASTRLAVWHWAVLDGQPVPSRPTKLGETYELLIAPAARHRELEVEDVFLGTGGVEEHAFLDIGPLSLSATVPVSSTTVPPAHATPR